MESIKKIAIFIMMLLLISCHQNKQIDKSTKSATTLPYFNSYDLTPQWGNNESINKHTIAPFSFINQEGDTVSQKDYEGKIYVTHFFFTSCTSICKLLINNMFVLQEEFKNDENIKFLSHSVTPQIDSVQKLKSYAALNQINSRQWSLVTGNKEDIYKMARESYFSDDDYLETKKASTFIHSENFLLIDPKGHIRGVYNGTLKLEMSRIAKHVLLLKKEFQLD